MGNTLLTGSTGAIAGGRAVDVTTARLWDAASGKPIGPPLEHQSGVTSVALSPDGKTAATGSAEQNRPAVGRDQRKTAALASGTFRAGRTRRFRCGRKDLVDRKP